MRIPSPLLSATAAALALIVLSCSNGTTDKTIVTETATTDFSSTNVYAVDFSSADVVNLTAAGLSGKTLILAKINKGSGAAYASATGTAALSSVVATSSRTADTSAATTANLPMRPPRKPHPLAGTYNATSASERSASNRSASTRTSVVKIGEGSTDYVVDSTTCAFWVDYYDSNGTLLGFDTLTATLKKITDHAYIWVANSGDTDNAECIGGFNPSTATGFNDKVQLLADAFESVVWPEDTAIFGFERGGVPNTGDGGIDGNQHISIFVYDIDLDNNAGGSYVAGYFWSKDDATANTTDVYASSGGLSYPSNGKEMFYLDAQALEDYPYTIVSTLAHEYQHMINYNKVKYEGRYKASTWLDEFRSLAAEDLLAPAFKAFSPNYDYFQDGPGYWVIYFNLYYLYAAGLTQWGGTTDDYAFASMLAAYLHRAYGGVAFMADHIGEANAGIGIDASLLDAIDSAFARTSFTDGTAPTSGAAFNLTSFFSGILEPFVYALWGLGADGSTGSSPFIRADAQAAGSLALDAFTLRNSSTAIIDLSSNITNSDYMTSINPGCYDLAASQSIPPYSFTFHTNGSLRNITQTAPITLTLTAPTDPDVVYRLIAIE